MGLPLWIFSGSLSGKVEKKQEETHTGTKEEIVLYRNNMKNLFLARRLPEILMRSERPLPKAKARVSIRISGKADAAKNRFFMLFRYKAFFRAATNFHRKSQSNGKSAHLAPKGVLQLPPDRI
jgi:hypothetical protein